MRPRGTQHEDGDLKGQYTVGQSLESSSEMHAWMEGCLTDSSARLDSAADCHASQLHPFAIKFSFLFRLYM